MFSSLSIEANVIDKPLGLSVTRSSTLLGLNPAPISVEVCCSRGPAFFQMVGLAQTPVREARVRVTSALAGIGVLLNEYAVTVNLAPAAVRKSDAALDLAIALGILTAIGRIPKSALDNTLLLGELSLDGRLQPIRGILPQLCGAKERGIARALVPRDNAREAGLVRELETQVAENLAQVVTHLCGKEELPQAPATCFNPRSIFTGLDLSDVHGQSSAKRALEIAAAGNHNVLFVGPPGTGKTMLARRLPTLLPPLTYEEAIETTAVHSVAGLVHAETGIVTERPFRAPHHSVTQQGLIGGGNSPRPGEVSLAHGGVLFLDEVAEFRRGVLEALRQPLEDGAVCISRARSVAEFPANPLLVAAMNPCPCGFFGHPRQSCTCSPKLRARYRAKLSGPLLERLDVHITLPPVEVSALSRPANGESSAVVQERVLAAREIQWARRRKGLTTAYDNSKLRQNDFARVLLLTSEAEQLMQRASRSLGLSARAFAKVLRVARTVADLENKPRVDPNHVKEALQGRLLERGTLS